MRCLADADIWMSKHYVTRPIAEYMLGVLMALQRVDGGNTIYFLGQVRGSGGWIYFPVLFLLKEPIPTLIIVFLALALALWWTIKRTVKNSGGARADDRATDAAAISRIISANSRSRRSSSSTGDTACTARSTSASGTFCPRSRSSSSSPRSCGKNGSCN